MNFTKEDLEKLPYYQLRNLGREVGVGGACTYKKAELIEKIISVCSGRVEPIFPKSGRPVIPVVDLTDIPKSIKKMEKKTIDLEEVEKIIDDFKNKLLKLLSKYEL